MCEMVEKWRRFEEEKSLGSPARKPRICESTEGISAKQQRIDHLDLY